jgi:hypothetical protein
VRAGECLLAAVGKTTIRWPLRKIGGTAPVTAPCNAMSRGNNEVQAMASKLADGLADENAHLHPTAPQRGGRSARAEIAASTRRGASIPQEVVDFAAYCSLHRVWLQRAILREAAHNTEPMRQLEQWTHESLGSVTDTCAEYNRELGILLQTHCRELAEEFWNEVRARAARLHDLSLRYG